MSRTVTIELEDGDIALGFRPSEDGKTIGSFLIHTPASAEVYNNQEIKPEDIPPHMAIIMALTYMITQVPGYLENLIESANELAMSDENPDITHLPPEGLQ